MKKFLMLFIFLFTFNLSSFTNTLPDKMNINESTGAEIMSIVFMGEKITAPGSYPGVPDLYTPVLDDLYLYGALSQRFSVLYYDDDDGKLTQDIMRELKNVQTEIRQRGYLPYPGDGSGSDYALVDIDGDSCPELLILQNFTYDTRKPEIKAVFAIRNGRLVCIDNGSSDLNYTILAADGTFYICIDWRAGYADLSAFRLEAGMSEFTVISEAHAALSFSDGDVPVPYWMKIENGEEISITEDEFDVLLKQYKDPKEVMILNFVPLHPDKVDPWSVPRPAEESLLTEPIECPQSYLGAPSAYKPILDDLYLFSERIRLGESFDYTWENAGNLGFREPPQHGFGYALADINNDGIPELFLGSMDGLNNASPNSIFTLKDGSPVLLTSFWSRSRGKISEDGIIYSVGSGGAAYTYLSSYRLDKNTDSLTLLTDMRSDYAELDGEYYSYYVKVVNGKNQYITKKEFWEYCDNYNNPPKPMELKVFPISKGN